MGEVSPEGAKAFVKGKPPNFKADIQSYRMNGAQETISIAQTHVLFCL
jgi:hypothetical protein